MSLRKESTLTEVYYPETEGKPTGETDLHIELITDLRFALKNFFREREDVYVASNLLLYYVEGDPTKFLVPDVLVASGVPKKPPRRTYKIWEEGRPPSVVIEVSSRETWLTDLQTKWQTYERMGVLEYFIFDPEYSYQSQPLLGYRLKEGQYSQLEVVGGRVRSEQLGVELVDTGETLRLWEPTSGLLLMTQVEVEEARRAAEEARIAEAQARLVEAEARRQAEEKLSAETEARRKAEEELARLRDQLDQLRRK